MEHQQLGRGPGSAVTLISTTSKVPLPPCAALITFSVDEQRVTAHKAGWEEVNVEKNYKASFPSARLI